jgi:FKBP12-rapamycin complex-associated protein
MSAGGGFRRLSSAVVIPDSQIVFIVSAVKGLMHAISLGTRKWTASVLQDMLYVLTIWFQFGHVPIVAASIEAGLSTMHLDTWLGVVPQLIARIDHNEDIPRHLLHNLLGRLGAKHPQALVYPLFVALKAPSEMRREAAKAQLNLLRQHSGTLIDQALLVTEELNRIAILWPEHWHETLEDASKQYFGEGNIVGMLETLAPVHELLERGPTTLHEAAFCQSFGNELLEAGECLKRYVRLMNETGKEIPRSGAAPVANPRKHRSQMAPEDLCLVQAWDLYYAVFKRITADLPQEMKLDLPQVSPSLVSCIDMNLAVPGSYSVNGSAVRIQKFGHVVHIIRSKQRPRKIRIIGEDGNEYVFLLKVQSNRALLSYFSY